MKDRLKRLVRSWKFGGEPSLPWLTNFGFRARSLGSDAPTADRRPPTGDDEARSTKYEVRGSPWA
jgi:hypothetical protein